MSENDHSVVRAVLAGDKDAYGSLVRSHSSAVFRVAFRITGNEADAEEIVQETFLRGYQRLPSFQLRSTFGTWIYRIAINCALNRMNQTGIDAEFRPGDETDPDDKVVQVAASSAGPERLLLSREIGAAHAAPHPNRAHGVCPEAYGRPFDPGNRRDSRDRSQCCQASRLSRDSEVA